MNNLAQLHIDRTKCSGCGRCVQVCPGSLFFLDPSHHAAHHPIERFGWDGCWKCQHCLAVCPNGAIRILGKDPKDSLPAPPIETAAPVLDALVANRRSHRRYQARNVEKETIRHLIGLLQNAPNGGNKLQVEYALVDDVEQMDRLRTFASERMDALAACGIYPDGYDAKSFQDLKRAEETVRPDMLFCGTPHLLIPHAPADVGCGWQDTAIAGTYFELLCAAHGLGAILMSFCLDVLKRMPDVWSLLHIPDDHCVSMAIDFGYPMIPYARGVQREDAVRSEVLSFPAVS